jgi:hypothetical protein
MKATTAIVLLAATALSACTTVPLNVPVEAQYVAPRTVVKLSATGYGAASSYDHYSEGQKKLMAMRASKLDAYRSLAEQVHGVRITGGSTVGAMMLQNDTFRVSIDAYIRGARVTNVTQMADGNYETTVEMDYDESVTRAFLTPYPVRSGYVADRSWCFFRCDVIAAGPAYVAAPAYNVPSGVMGSVGPGSLYGSYYYYAQ